MRLNEVKTKTYEVDGQIVEEKSWIAVERDTIVKNYDRKVKCGRCGQWTPFKYYRPQYGWICGECFRDIAVEELSREDDKQDEINPSEKELLSPSPPRQEEPSPPPKTISRGLGFTDKGLEELVLDSLHKLPGVKEKAHVPREELRGIHFDAWVEVKDKYIVAECKGGKVSSQDVRDFNSRTEKLRKETKEKVEPWIVTSSGFEPGGSEEAQYWEMKMIERRELLKMLLAKGLIKVDLEEGEPILNRDKGVYIEMDENQIKES